MKTPIILIAEDDSDDRLIIQEAIEESEHSVQLKFVHDGEQLISYMEKSVEKINDSDLPSIILLDLNMPKIDGREALKFLKSHKIFKKIPTIVLTTSHAAEDIAKTYDMGVNSFITKPTNFSEMVEIANRLSTYWFNTVKLP